MKNKTRILLLMFTISTLLTGCQSVSDTGISDTAVVREFDPTDDAVYIDDSYTALSGSVEDASMTEEERARAAQLRQIAQDAIALVNETRVAAGLNSLEQSDELEIAAQVRANECVSSFSHTRPDGSAWWTVNSTIMYGENLAKGYQTAENVMAAWMNSPTHAANILYGDFNTIGIAIYELDGKIYWAQEFGY